MDLRHYEDWLRPEHKPRCSVCLSPVVHHSADEGTQSYEELYTEDVGALVSEVKRLSENLRIATEALELAGEVAYYGFLEKTAHTGWTDKSRENCAKQLRDEVSHAALEKIRGGK